MSGKALSTRGLSRPEVVGYHGTHQQYAEQIINAGFEPSRKSYDWLGYGWYLWQDDLERATEWAQEHHGANAAVIEAVVDLSACFDLIQRKYLVALERHADQILGRMPPAQLAKMRQTDMLHDVDRLLIDAFCDGWATPDGSRRFTSVRGCFKEGDPLYDVATTDPGPRFLTSALRSMDHVQIAVRDEAAITEWQQR